jgi:hypothetical protein
MEKSALQGGSNTNTTTGPEMTDIQKICNFCQAHNNMVQKFVVLW